MGINNISKTEKTKKVDKHRPTQNYHTKIINTFYCKGQINVYLDIDNIEIIPLKLIQCMTQKLQRSDKLSLTHLFILSTPLHKIKTSGFNEDDFSSQGNSHMYYIRQLIGLEK